MSGISMTICRTKDYGLLLNDADSRRIRIVMLSKRNQRG